MKFFEKQHFTLFSNFYFYILQSVQMQIKKKISSHMPGNDKTDIQIIVSNQYLCHIGWDISTELVVIYNNIHY